MRRAGPGGEPLGGPSLHEVGETGFGRVVNMVDNLAKMLRSLQIACSHRLLSPPPASPAIPPLLPIPPPPWSRHGAGERVHARRSRPCAVVDMGRLSRGDNGPAGHVATYDRPILLSSSRMEDSWRLFTAAPGRAQPGATGARARPGPWRDLLLRPLEASRILDAPVSRDALPGPDRARAGPTRAQSRRSRRPPGARIPRPPPS